MLMLFYVYVNYARIMIFPSLRFIRIDTKNNSQLSVLW